MNDSVDNNSVSEVADVVGEVGISDKQIVMKKFGRSENDTGSPEVQIALVTSRLEALSKHFSKHPKDNHSRQGMFRLISQRKDLLAYVRRQDVQRYRAIVSALGLRK